MIQTAAERSAREEELFQALHDVPDAEFDIDVVDMGLIYAVRFGPESGRVVVDMTFTAMACPALDFMSQDVVDRLLAEPDVREAHVEVVWDPPWTHEMLTGKGVSGLAEWGVITWA